MKIVSFVDKIGSAIHRLEVMNQQRLKHIDYVVLPFHPKRPSDEEIAEAKKHIVNADLIHWAYWKSAVTIRGMIPEANSKPNVLTHHNEHNVIGDWPWMDIKWGAHVVKNGWQKKRLAEKGIKAILIKHAPEFDNFKFTQELTKEKIVGYVGQIKKVKGVRELKQACDELGYRLLLLGKPSEGAYWAEMDKNNLLYNSDIKDADIGEIYSKMRVYCANSDDGTESGTVPILEAMVSGIPVVTRKIGLVRDCGDHQKNMFIREGKYTDIEDLKSALKMVIEDDYTANELRENAWRTVRQYHPEVQAREYDKLFRKIMYSDQPLVSVIMPTCDRIEVLKENLENLNNQSYKNFEVIICDDGKMTIVNESLSIFNYPVKNIKTNGVGYGLAKARNMGLIEALGDIVVFCDDRLKMHPNAIKGFMEKLQRHSDNKKTWVWGNKGKFKTFVENFSATWKQSVIDGGNFNERIDGYGGMTQEISSRFGRQGFEFVWCPEALAEPIIGTHSKSRNRESIIRMKILLYKLGLQ